MKSDVIPDDGNAKGVGKRVHNSSWFIRRDCAGLEYKRKQDFISFI